MVFLNLLFWAFLASYIVHILDETLLNGGFVQWIADNFWPTYTWRMFFWIILPLICLAGFVTHAATVHVFWTIRRDTYSPGLLTSLLYVMIFYLLIKYGLGPHLMTGTDFAIGTVAGVATVGAFLTVGPTLLFPRLTRPRAN